MKLSETELNLDQLKIEQLQIEIEKLNEQIDALINNFNKYGESLKDTQRYLIKLARNQQELTKRITSWPYIVVDNQDEGI